MVDIHDAPRVPTGRHPEATRDGDLTRRQRDPVTIGAVPSRFERAG